MGAKCPDLLSPALNTTGTISSPTQPCSEMQSASPCHHRVYRYFQLDYKNCPQFADIPVSKAGKDAGVRTHVWWWLQHAGAQGLGAVDLQQRPAKSAGKVEDNRMCMSLEGPRQSTRFCWLYGVGFCLDHQQPCSEMQVICLSLLKNRVNPSLPPALLAKGRMLLCSNSSWHMRAIKISVSVTLLFTTGMRQFDISRHLPLSTAPALPFRRRFAVHPASVPQRAFKQC